MGPGGTSSDVGRACWPNYLRGEHAQEILARLRESDPLRLREATARRLREVWYLLEPDRVFYRTLAVVAEHAMTEDAPEDLNAWARSKVDVAIERLLRLDWAAEKSQPEILSDEERDFPLLTKSLMLEPESVRRVSVAFNALEPLPRRAFFELLIEGRTVEECVEAGPWNEDGLYEAIQAALAPLGLDAKPAPTDDPRQEKERSPR